MKQKRLGSEKVGIIMKYSTYWKSIFCDCESEEKIGVCFDFARRLRWFAFTHPDFNEEWIADTPIIGKLFAGNGSNQTWYPRKCSIFAGEKGFRTSGRKTSNSTVLRWNFTDQNIQLTFLTRRKLNANAKTKSNYHQVLRNTLINHENIHFLFAILLVCQSLIAQITMDPEVWQKFVMMHNKIWLMIITPLSFDEIQQVARRTNGRVFRQNPEEKKQIDRLDSNNWRYVLDKMARSFTQGGNTSAFSQTSYLLTRRPAIQDLWKQVLFLSPESIIVY
jgi:hypothetical protein